MTVFLDNPDAASRRPPLGECEFFCEPRLREIERARRREPA